MSRVSPKDPDTVEWFNWDFTRQIQSGAGGTIASIVSGPFQETGEGDDAVTIVVPAAIDAAGLIVSAKLAGGTNGTDYGLTVRVLTTAGETLDQTLRFFCSNAQNN